MSYIVNNSNKKGCVKRKLSFTGEDPDLNCTTKPSKKFSKALLENNGISKTKNDYFPKLYLKKTNAYTQVIAKPEFLPRTPKIFCFNKEKEKGSEASDNFFLNFLTMKTFNGAVSERFTNATFNNDSNTCNKTAKNGEIKNKEGRKEKIPEEKLERSVINEEEKEKKRRKEAKRRRKEEKKRRKEEMEIRNEDKEMRKEDKEIRKEDKEIRKVKEIRKEKQIENKEIRKHNVSNKFSELNERNTAHEENVAYEIAGSVNIYKVVNKNGLIFHVPHPNNFSFYGEIRITALLGEVEILGYRLSPFSAKTSVDAYSPEYYSSLTVQTNEVNQKINTEELKMKLKDFLTKHDSNELLLQLKPNDCILYIEQIISNFGIVVNKYLDIQFFPKDLEDVSSKSESNSQQKNKIIKSLQSIFRFHLRKGEKYFVKNFLWDSIKLDQCTVYCGGKGVGKSTLLKYHINKLVSSGEKVLCLDLDPGQPEFQFPSCVSAVIVDEPLIGPNFTHIKDPVVMTCFGDVDVAQNPNKYLECVKYVIKSCQKNEELRKLRWFVNTMGFCKGIGVNLMIAILKLVNPDRVVQINCSDLKNNYPFYLTPKAVNSASDDASMVLDNVSLSYEFRLMYSVAENERKLVQGSLKQTLLRDIMSISYFSRMISPPLYNLNAVQPYLISFSKLYLGIDFIIDPRDVLKAFNGNTVSLSHFEPDNEEIISAYSEEEQYFKVVVKPRVTPCLGIGFVRGIDCNEKRFYLITHLPVEILDNVNCLTLGRRNLPQFIFSRQDTVEGQTFYTTQGSRAELKSVKKSFRQTNQNANTCS